MLRNKQLAIVLMLALCVIPAAYADSIAVFEISNKTGDKIVHTVSIDGRWLRIDSNPRGKASHILIDTGYHRYYDVYENDKAYQLTQVGRLYWPETPLLSPRFKLLRENKAIAGMRCQPVNEIGEDKKPIAEHCMATGSTLGLNAREMMTLSRLFMIMRRTGGSLEKSWIGAATPDERQISILSVDPAGNRMEIKSVSHDNLDYRLLNIPKEYKEIKPVLPEGGPLVPEKKPEKPVKQ